jgi:hypothetical protein
MRRLSMAILMATTAWVGTAVPGDDEFRQAVNYVFSGNTEGRTPQLLSSIVDQHNCIISVETPGNSWVYYMKEIKPDSIVIDEHNRKISLEGDSTIVEHTFEGLQRNKENKNTITLRGDIERTKDAVCTENLIRIDCVTESPNVKSDDRALLPLPDPVHLAVQVEEPT